MDYLENGNILARSTTSVGARGRSVLVVPSLTGETNEFMAVQPTMGTLISNGLLQRVVDIPAPSGSVLLRYSGRDIGRESVSINDDDPVSHSSYFWYVPTFEIEHDSGSYIIEIRIWPWLALRSMTVTLDKNMVYTEGSRPYEVSWMTECTNILLFFLLSAILIFAPVLTAIGTQYVLRIL